jgi:DNA topoisomerase IA
LLALIPFSSLRPTMDLSKEEKLHGAAQPATSLEDISSSSDRDLDETYRVYKATEQLEATEAEVKKVIRKIDKHVVPILFVTYMLQYLDKNSLNFSSVYGLSDGTNLHGQDYSWLGEYTSDLDGHNKH